MVVLQLEKEGIHLLETRGVVEGGAQVVVEDWEGAVDGWLLRIVFKGELDGLDVALVAFKLGIRD